MISLESLELLDEMLSSASVSVGADGFEETSRNLAKAKRELQKELSHTRKLKPKKPKKSSTKKRK
jgi:dsDNA-binding SOS-regulon protein